MTDYLPDSAVNRLAYFTNLKTQVHAEAATLGWPAAKVTAFDAWMDPITAVYQRVVDADLVLQKASGDAHDLFDATNAKFRATVNELKTNPAFTEGMGKAMNIYTQDNAPAPADIKPSLNVPEVHRGGVRLTGSKNYAETVNLYMRRKGGAWTLIAPKRKRFPFEDQAPLLVAGVPEEREYLAHGVMGDEEVGFDSDIVTAVFNG